MLPLKGQTQSSQPPQPPPDSELQTGQRTQNWGYTSVAPSTLLFQGPPAAVIQALAWPQSHIHSALCSPHVTSLYSSPQALLVQEYCVPEYMMATPGLCLHRAL